MVKQRKNRLLPLGILLLLIFGGYLISTKFVFNSTKISGTLYALIQQNKDQVCTWDETAILDENMQSGRTNNIKTKGIVHISGNKFAVETQTTLPDMIDGPRKIYLIGDGKNTYQWTDLANDPPGMKTDYAPVERLKNSTTHLNYSCKNWIPEATKFDVPQNIEFRDLDQEEKERQQN